MSFVHLHTHSEYSLLDGANRIPDLVAHVKKLGMDSLAVTDHGNLHAAWSFYDEARRQSIRPILGFEAYLAFGSRQAPAEAAPARRPPTATWSCWPRTGPATRTSSGSAPSASPRGSTAVPGSTGGAGQPLRGPRLPGRLPVGRDRRSTSGRATTTRRSARREWFAAHLRPERLLARDPEARHPRGARWSPRGCSGWAGSSGSAWWPPTTRTTSAARTPRRTTCCWPSGPAPTSTTPSGSASPGRNRTSSPKRRCGALPGPPRDARQHRSLVADLCEFDFEKRYFLPGFPAPADGFASEDDSARAPGHGGRGASAMARRCRTPAVASTARCPSRADRLDFELKVIREPDTPATS